MRRWPLLLTCGVAVLFVAMAIPGSPLSAWLVRVVAGGNWGAVGEGPPPAAGPGAPRPILRAAVGAMVTPERTYQDYRKLLQVIAEDTGHSLELVQRKTYREVNDLIAVGAVDLAWVCTGALPDLGERGAARILAVPVVGGRTDYRSYLIVGSSSHADSLDDLRGTVFAFTDPLSLTGRKVVEFELGRVAETPEGFFRDFFFTHAHDSSISAVRDGLATAAAVDSLVYDYLAETEPPEVAGTRVIWRSKPFPIPPLVVPSSLDPSEFDALRRSVLNLHADPAARAYLEHLRVDRFVTAPADVYFPG